MRLFRVESKGGFTEFKALDFSGEHRETTLESWLESNPDSIVEDGRLLLIGRQVSTNFGLSIDLLALDRDGSTVVLELKRDRTPRETLAQALEYGSFVEGLDYERLQQLFTDYIGDEGTALSEYHKQYFGLEDGVGVSFNKDQRIVIVGQNITPQIRQTAMFLRRKGMSVTCVEFNFFQTESGEQLLSTDTVVGKEPSQVKAVSTGALPKVDRKKFLESVDDSARPVFEQILALSEEHNFPIHWGSKGFTQNVNIDGTHIVLCWAQPPSSVYGQCLMTGFWDINRKVEGGEDLSTSFRRRLEELLPVVDSGAELKYVIQQQPKAEQITELKIAIVELADAIQQRGLRSSTEATTG